MKIKSLRTTGLHLWWLVSLIFVLDISSKFWVMTYLQLHEPHPLLSFFHITYERNFGAAFSFFYGYRWPLAIIAIAIIFILVVMLYKNPRDDKAVNIGYVLILGGAVGNLFDRLWHGFVVDFFDVYILGWRYPTFNIADSAICIGAALLIWAGFRNNQSKKTE